MNPKPIIDGMCKGSLSIGTGCKRCGKCAVEMQSIITSLEQDNKEQCRLNAMGVEREARLMARVKELEKDAARYLLRLETIRALYPSAPSDIELDTAIDAAMQKD